MPIKFDEELHALKEKIVDMGERAQEMFQLAMRALVQRDAALLDEVLKYEEQVDQFQIDVDDTVIRLVTTYGPVALDLRFVLMVARINTELERIGDQSCNMCENVQLLLREPALKELVDLPRMADTASAMVRQALQAFKENDTDRALEVIRRDNEVDALNDQLFRELLTYMMSDSHNITRALALLLIARSLERIADHATNIAEEVVFVVKGKDIRHQDVV